MDLGLGNLIELKRQLLAASLVSGTDYDSKITAIGQGVAAAFDCYCNRKFERVANDTVIFSADRTHYFLPRFPVESVSAVAIKDDEAGGFVAQTVNDVILVRDDACGQIQFGTVLGVEMSKVKVTYTGGYWFDSTEDGTGVQPAGATVLPQDVKLAWFIQCREIWGKDPLRTGISNKPTDPVSFTETEFVPQVTMILDRYKRYQMT